MEKASKDLMDKLGYGLGKYEEEISLIEEATKSRIVKAQDKMNLACRDMMNDMEHAKNVEKERVTML
eukprot:7644250-Karenia_brevis.AAC.1